MALHFLRFHHCKLACWLLLLCFSALGLIASSNAATDLFTRRDVVHLRNGETLSDCKALTVIGIHVVMKCGVGEEKRTLNRLAIMGYLDTMTLRSGEVITGEIAYFDGHDFDVKTTSGMRRFPRWKVKSLELGLPSVSATQAEWNPPATTTGTNP
jgi:hypothetical protein